MQIISFLFTGLIIGLFGRLIVPGRQPLGCWWTTLAGIVGSLLAGLLGRQVWGHAYAPNFVASVLGAAIVVLLLTRALGSTRSTRWR